MTSEQFKKIKAHAILARDTLRPVEARSFKNRLVFEHVIRDFVFCVQELDKIYKATADVNAGGDH